MAAILLFLLIIPLFVLAAFVLIGSGRPVIFLQQRVGRGGRIFNMLKFRTMNPEAERMGPMSTAIGDPRITPVGRLLRRTSLDELPQLVNILFGDMSFIGPRPDVPSQETAYSEEHWRQRVSIRPGLTGLAQVKARHTAGMRRRTQYDLFYVEKFALMLDLKIAFWTLGTVLRGSY